MTSWHDRIHTWREIRKMLSAEGITDSTVLEFVRRATATLRREKRKFLAYCAAEEFVRRELDLHYLDKSLAMYILLDGEASGLHGGGFTNPGSGTSRHVAFAHLGKGRRHASDGYAWTAAIQEAAWDVERDLWKYAQQYGYKYPDVRLGINDDGELTATIYDKDDSKKSVSVVVTPKLFDYEQAITYIQKKMLDSKLDDVDAAVILAKLHQKLSASKTDTSQDNATVAVAL